MSAHHWFVLTAGNYLSAGGIYLINVEVEYRWNDNRLDVMAHIQYIPRNMHTVFALLCFIVVIHWLIFPYPSGLLHWHCGNLTIAPVPAKQPWWIWINTSCEFIMNDCITTTKQSTTKPCAYFLGYTVWVTNQLSFYRQNMLVLKKRLSLLEMKSLIQYIPRNMHTVLLCFALLWLCNRS